MRLRRLNDHGLAQAREFLSSLTTDTPQDWPEDTLTDPGTSEELQVDVEVEQREFSSRMELAQYLDGKFEDAGLTGFERDKGLWGWLALFFFDQLCPPDTEGRRKPGELARWIPAVGDFRKYYRHLLAGPCLVYRAHKDHPDSALALLCGPVHKPGDIVEQLASRQELVTNTAVMEVATTLYVDPDTRQPRRGAAGRGGGSARRLADVLNQYDVTWDLYSMTAQELAEMLPPEFDRFLPEG